MMTGRTKTVAVAGLLAGALTLGGLGLATAQPSPETGPGPMANHGRGEMHQQGAPAGMAGMGAHQGMGGAGGGMSMDAGRHFIQEMIPHHEDAVAMAAFALDQAEHPEIRQLAADIQRVQTEEIAQMQSWYQQWYGADVPAGMMGGMDGNGLSLDGATPFDKAFIEQMAPHHEQAVMMASMALQSADRPELRTLLQSIIASQKSEIAQMRTWYQQWYGAELPAGMGHPGHGR